MADSTWCLAVVTLSESFGTSLEQLVHDLGGAVVKWVPAETPAPPPGAGAVAILAGGAESDALDLLGTMDGLALPRFVIGAAAEHRLAAGLVAAGARDYFALPDDLALLRRAFEREAREWRSRDAAAEFAGAERESTGFEAIVGASPALLAVLDQARKVARHRDVTVLVGGETGTGKELLARAIHYAGPRAAAPFVEINCAAIPATLLESELFGHEKGAFTGAIAAKPGLFELAHGGTVFLDEIGHLPLELQPKLLRALQQREIRRVGGQQVRAVDVRVIGATHVDLRAAVRRGEFREDLFYRLCVVELVLPPLRERGDDVELLAERFVHRLAAQYGLPAPSLGAEVRRRLRAGRWPGNIRELRNALERALVLSPPGTLDAAELQLHGPIEEEAHPAAAGGDGQPPLPFPAELRVLVRAAALQMLELTKGNKSEAARRLGISRPRLQRLLDGQTDDD